MKLTDVRELREKLGEKREGGLTAPVAAKSAGKAIQNDLEGPFLLRWNERYPDLPLRREVRFHETRKWRFDFAAENERILVAVEIEGGQWTTSRHRTGTGYEEDCHKYNEAAAAGWSVFRLTPGLSRNDFQLATIAYVMRQKRDALAGEG